MLSCPAWLKRTPKSAVTTMSFCCGNNVQRMFELAHLSILAVVPPMPLVHATANCHPFPGGRAESYQRFSKLVNALIDALWERNCHLFQPFANEIGSPMQLRTLETDKMEDKLATAVSKMVDSIDWRITHKKRIEKINTTSSVDDIDATSSESLPPTSIQDATCLGIPLDEVESICSALGGRMEEVAYLANHSWFTVGSDALYPHSPVELFCSLEASTLCRRFWEKHFNESAESKMSLIVNKSLPKLLREQIDLNFRSPVDNNQ